MFWTSLVEDGDVVLLVEDGGRNSGETLVVCSGRNLLRADGISMGMNEVVDVDTTNGESCDDEMYSVHNSFQNDNPLLPRN